MKAKQQNKSDPPNLEVHVMKIAFLSDDLQGREQLHQPIDQRAPRQGLRPRKLLLKQGQN